MTSAESKVLAGALYELTSLLGCLAGADAPYELQLAWRLAYALHNDALAVMEGKGFDPESSLSRIADIDRLLGGDDGKRIADQIRQVISPRN
jgi:hypothetical protein